MSSALTFDELSRKSNKHLELFKQRLEPNARRLGHLQDNFIEEQCAELSSTIEVTW